MNDHHGPYPTVIDSGISSLGVIPAHWELVRSKAVLRNVNETTSVRRHGDSYIALEHVESWTGRLRQSDVETAFDSQVKRFKVGDVLFGKLRPYLAKTTRPSTAGVCVGEFLVLRPRTSSISSDFAEVLLRSKPIVEAVSSSTFGAKMPRADWQFVGGMRIPLPPLPEQHAIVRYLDYMDRRIRRYIRAKQKLIKLLEEQKQAIINEAVTGKIDVRTGKPYPAYKDSGVEWLGLVPEGWESLTLRRVITRAVDGPHHSPSYIDDGIPFLSARNVKTDRWCLDDAKFISEEDYEAFSKRVVPEVGDVLYTKGGTTGVARAVDLPFRFQVWVHVAVLKVMPTRVWPDYLALILNSPRCYEQAQLFTRGATNQDLGLGRMKGICFALPPIAEQETILTHLSERTAARDAGAEVSHRQIHLLREYRTRLIADVVTGKLDVRAAAAALPDEVEELEELGEIEGDGVEDGENTEESMDRDDERVVDG